MELFAATESWIVALGKTLIHSIWIALFLLSMLRLFLISIPDRYSELRYRISLTSMLILLGSAATLFFLMYSPEKSMPLISDAEKSSSLLAILLKDSGLLRDKQNPHLIFVLCTYLYLAGIPIVLIRSAFSLRYLRRMKDSGIPVEGEWHRRFMQLKESLGINRNVELMETSKVTTPALIGFLKPLILIPAGMFSNLSVNQVETILLHELYHLRRFDSLTNVIQLAIENLFFFNPAVWAISRLIRNEREKCCDDRVLDSCGDPLNYAKALYQLAGQNHFSHLAPGAGGTDQFQLFTRINRILNQNTMKNTIRERLISLLIFASGALIMLTVSGFSSGFSIMMDKESKQLPVVVSDTVPSVEKDGEPVEEARLEVLEEIDWEEIREEMEEARLEVMEEIDWEEIREEMADAKVHFDSVMMDFDFDMDVDFDKIKEEVNSSLENIDWKEIENEMARVRIQLDSVLQDMDLDFDMDVDL